MISFNILFARKEDAERALDLLIEEKLFYGGYIQNIINWKRGRNLPKYNFSFQITGLTRAISHNNVLTALEKNFSNTDYLAFTTPILNLSGNHEQLLKSTIN